MKHFTYEEMELMSIYDPGTREGLIANLEEMRGYLEPDETELRELTDSALEKLRELSDEDIRKIANTYNAFAAGTLEDVKGFCAVATTAEIKGQDYILTPGRYVGIEEQEDDGEPFEEKMARLTGELSELFQKSHQLEEQIRDRLGAIGYEV